jgi:hypothetical protein
MVDLGSAQQLADPLVEDADRPFIAMPGQPALQTPDLVDGGKIGNLEVASKRCTWPTSYLSSCGQEPARGRLCPEHLDEIQPSVGTWDCAWPGCQQVSGAKRGLCPYHSKIAAGLMETYLR